MSLNGDRQSRPVTDFETSCPFCPGPSSEVGELPFDVAVFENKFPAFWHPGNAEIVVCSPRHYDDLAYLPLARARLIWKVWAARVHDLEEEPGTRAVFIFEDRGQKVGATVGHSHGQIYAYPGVGPSGSHARRPPSPGTSPCVLIDTALSEGRGFVRGTD